MMASNALSTPAGCATAKREKEKRQRKQGLVTLSTIILSFSRQTM